MLLGAEGHLFERVAGVPAVDIQPGRPGVDEERHGHTERVRESAERIGLRLAQVVFIPRQRRLRDSDGQLGLGEALRSAGRLQDLAKITVWVPKVTCRVVLGTQTVIFPPARWRESGSTGRDVAAHQSPPLRIPGPEVAARDVGVDGARKEHPLRCSRAGAQFG